MKVQTFLYSKKSPPIVKRLVIFFRTVAIGTPRALRAKKLVKIMPTKMRLTGNQSCMIAMLNFSTLIKPAKCIAKPSGVNSKTFTGVLLELG